ncbi:hypothetical protein ABID56_000382 [Alkalibacillus flavidus]|uniref:Uncharacterized protein n=1 Tax=Alkalibacillus flavidus TaxID=546021 RepID=A0ABV2KRU6_9BACI
MNAKIEETVYVATTSLLASLDRLEESLDQLAVEIASERYQKNTTK